MDKKENIVSEYIESVLSQVENKAWKNEVEEEIYSHIQEKTDFYISLGHDKETAEEEAVKAMGNPEKLGDDFNRLHSSKPALIIANVCCIVFFILADYGSIINKNIYNFMIISTDGGELVQSAFIVSVAAFAVSAICFRLCLKNRFSKTAVNLGTFSVASIINPFLFLPVGYSIIGAVTDFPACFAAKDFLFFGGQMGWGLDKYLSSPNILIFLQYAEIIFTALFFASPLITGIFAIVMGWKMQKDRDFVYKEKHFNRFSVILCIIAFLSAVAVTAEISVDYVKTYNQSIEFSNTEYKDYNNAKLTFDDLSVPADKDYVYNLALSCPDKEDKLAEYENSFLTVEDSPHCAIQIRDNDENGIYETKRMYSKTDKYVTVKQIKKLGGDITSHEFFEIIPISDISDYSLSVYPDKTTEKITVCRKRYNAYAEKEEVFYVFYFENGRQVDMKTDTVVL